VAVTRSSRDVPESDVLVGKAQTPGVPGRPFRIALTKSSIGCLHEAAITALFTLEANLGLARTSCAESPIGKPSHFGAVCP
jgi:hypothetical protein